MLKSFKGSWCSCWLSRNSGKTLKFLLNSLWIYYGVSLTQIHIIWIPLSFSWSNDICACPTWLFFASREGYQFWHNYTYQKGSGGFKNDRNENRCYYFPKPTYGSSGLQPDSPVDLVFSLWLQKTFSNFFHSWLLPYSLDPLGLNSQATLKGLELILHLYAPCQYKPTGIKSKKSRVHPMPTVCFVYWELLFHCSHSLFVWGWIFWGGI